MDTIQTDEVTPRTMAEKARPLYELYADAYPGAQIADLITNLAHLADQTTDQGGAATLRNALLHYQAEHDLAHPVPGTEYPFSISDISRATARLLGPGWLAESGSWGVSGSLCGPYLTEFVFVVDYEGDLAIEFRPATNDGFPEVPELPDGVIRSDQGVYLYLASAADGLKALAERSAAAIRAVTGYDPAEFDFESSASRQHHTDTGRYLRKG
ncbi:hypothetical protein [Streptomyces longispororuber]|uniref:hypothetical protein n=1 Tax=Streptomyces longispororuber TaxID=68230 RepID=UPI0037012F61